MKPTNIRRRCTLLVLTLAAAQGFAQASGPFGPVDFATSVIAYDGTHGVPNYTTHPEYALGPPSADALPAVPDNTSLVSFGWGGYLTLGFSRPIANDSRNPGGYDFIVFGNAMYAGGDELAPNREPGYVQIGVDPSGAHAYGPNVKWYWLKGSPAPASLSGFPIPLPSWDTTVWGYADCTPTDGMGDPLVPDDPFTPGILADSAGGDAFDLDWAVDDTGASVHLPYADFVRITCAVNLNQGVLGYLSTEVDAVSIVRPRIMGDVDFDGKAGLSDAVLVLRSLNGLETLSVEQTHRADASGHGGGPTVADAAAMLRIASGLRR